MMLALLMISRIFDHKNFARGWFKGIFRCFKTLLLRSLGCSLSVGVDQKDRKSKACKVKGVRVDPLLFMYILVHR